MSNPCRLYMFKGDVLTDEYTLVDADIYLELSKSKWRKNKDGYAYGHDHRKTITLHQHIMKKILHEKVEGNVIDHADGNRLNNTNANLHFASPGQNAQNRDFTVGTSGYRCVHLTRYKTYEVRIRYTKRSLRAIKQ